MLLNLFLGLTSSRMLYIIKLSIIELKTSQIRLEVNLR